MSKSFGSQIDIQSKTEGNEVVTKFDIELDKLMREFLLKETGISTLSEEGGYVQGKITDYLWIIDPIDGTTNFSRGVPVFATTVALRHKDEIILGVNGIYQEHDIYWATKDQGAFKNGLPLSVSKVDHPSPLIFLNNGYSDLAHKRCKIQTERISNRFAKRSFGTTVVELSLVAEGKFDGFVCSGDKIWDFASSILLVKEAGGIVSDWSGNPFKLDRDDLICSNPKIHAELVEISKDLVETY